MSRISYLVTRTFTLANFTLANLRQFPAKASPTGETLGVRLWVLGRDVKSLLPRISYLANFTLANFTLANFTLANFTLANFTLANFTLANFTLANFTLANLNPLTFTHKKRAAELLFFLTEE
ncbi:pentapeptide repeat-containing protein [Pseudoalteromonas sp.]|uniref:pentapeptide repeat-containing protein n=1 Tax=Pseudoalteromonas sp. TaxID=53249 RepID=UPI0033904503